MGKCRNFLKNRDQLGVPVDLNFRGESTYQTAFGGVCSLIGMFVTSFLTFAVLFSFMKETKFD